MNVSKRIAIIGTGAVGGYYGALLQRSGFEVHFLLNSDYEHVTRKGLFIESINGNFSLPSVHAYKAAKDMPKCGTVIIALKTTANHLLANILPHAATSTSTILTLQNGLGSEEQIAESTTANQIFGGLCFLCSNKVGPGHIRHLDYGLITLGEYRASGKPAGCSSQLIELSEKLQSASIPIKQIDDLALARWKKLVWNIPFNGLSVIRNELTDQLIQQTEPRELCISMMNEVAAAAAACARPIEPDFIEKMIADTEKMKPYAPSMKLDFDRKKPMEIESIYGRPLQKAAEAGIPMPVTQHIYHQLKEINSTI